MFEEAAHWLSSQAQAHFAVSVKYVTRGGEELEVKAVIGKTLFQSADSYGMTATTETRDFIIDAEALSVEPQQGDAVIWNGTRYEVLAPSGEPCWRWSDPYQIMKRIHTKEV